MHWQKLVCYVIKVFLYYPGECFKYVCIPGGGIPCCSGSCWGVCIWPAVLFDQVLICWTDQHNRCMCCYRTFVVFSDHFPALIDSLARMFAHACTSIRWQGSPLIYRFLKLSKPRPSLFCLFLLSSLNTAVACLRRMQKSGELCDVRAIMAASSPFFRGMFWFGWKEPRKYCLKRGWLCNICCCISLQWWSHSTWRSSTKPLVSSWSVSNAEHLWCLLQVLESQTEAINCIGLAALVDLHNCKSLSNVDTE